MNAFQNYFNPMSSFQQGADFINQADEAAWRNQERKRMLAQRQALSDFGQGGYLMGFEGVPGAERSPDLQGLWKHDPEMALQVEQRMSAPFSDKRSLQHAIDLDAAKTKAAWAEAAPFLQEEGQSQGAPGNSFSQQWAPQPITGMGTEQGMNAPGSGVLAPPPRPSSSVGGIGSGDAINSLSGRKKMVEISGGKPIIKYDYVSPLDRELKIRESSQKDRQTELDASRTAETLDAGREARIQTARENVNKYAQEISALETKAHEGVDVRGQLEFYRNKLSKEESRLQKLEGGGTSAPSSAQLTPEEKAMAAQAKAKKPSAAGQPMAAPSTGLAGVGQGLPPKQRIEEQAKATADKRTMANNDVKDAKEHAAKSAGVSEAMIGLKNLLTKSDVGSPMYNFGLPFSSDDGPTFGQKIAELASQDNQELVTYGQALMPLFRQPGESKTIDTIPELRINTAQAPNVKNRPDVNRKLFSALWNKWDASTQYGDFLEKWRDSHNQDVTGAQHVFRDWMKHNPAMGTEDVNGRTQMKDLPQVSLENWAILRDSLPSSMSGKDIRKGLDNGTIRILGGKALIRK